MAIPQNFSFADRCIFFSTTMGTTSFTVGQASTGFQLPAAAGVIDGQVHWYAAQNSNSTQWEYGYGTWSGGVTLLSRTPVQNSLGTNALINFTSQPTVILSIGGESLVRANQRNFLTPNVGDTAGTKRFFVSPTGSDVTGDGSNANPWATVQFAFYNICALWNWTAVASTTPVYRNSTQFNTVIIQLMDGTYNVTPPIQNAGAYFGQIPPTSNMGCGVSIFGNLSDKTKVIWNGPGFGATGFWIDGGFSSIPFAISNITFTNWRTGILLTYASSLYLTDCVWGVTHAGTGTDISISHPQCALFYYSTQQITASRGTHINSSGFIDFSFGSTVTLTGTPAFSGSFINMGGNGAYSNTAGGNMSFVGSATGKRFALSNGASLIGTGSRTFFPGDTAGTIASQSTYT